MKASLDADDPDGMTASVRLNWRLWTIIQAELLDPQCTVPGEIRINVLSLAQFVDRRTLDYLARPEPQKLGALISINRELAGGLFTSSRPEHTLATADGDAQASVPDQSDARNRPAAAETLASLRIST